MAQPTLDRTPVVVLRRTGVSQVVVAGTNFAANATAAVAAGGNWANDGLSGPPPAKPGKPTFIRVKVPDIGHNARNTGDDFDQITITVTNPGPPPESGQGTYEIMATDVRRIGPS